jgi:hypothetical protein
MNFTYVDVRLLATLRSRASLKGWKMLSDRAEHEPRFAADPRPTSAHPFAPAASEESS